MEGTVSRTRSCGARRHRSVEFHIYFAFIFLLAIPFKICRWLAAVTRARPSGARGPLAQAWAEAERVTPIIFSA